MSEKPRTSNIIGPLNFSEPSNGQVKLDDAQNVQCLMCDLTFEFDEQKDECLAHLFLIHKLVIGEVQQVSILPEYINHWRQRFKDNPKLEDFCTVLLLNKLPDGTPAPNEKYFLLSNDLLEDFELRKRLHLKRLEEVLAQHQFERTDKTFERGCLYCRDVVSPTRAAFIEHLFQKHFLLLGKAENLVFIEDLIDCIADKLDRLICLYCEKVFKDRTILKEHMRKKGHKRINPDNKCYDMFFLVNYKNEPIPPKSVSAMDNFRESTPRVFQTADDSDSDWSDWEGEDSRLTCLYCSATDTNFGALKDHMRNEHNVDFDECVAEFNFYQKIKIVNYVRRQMHTLRCVTCDEEFTSKDLLDVHLKEMSHYGIGSRKSWDQPEHFFPTYEDDAVLCQLEDAIDSVGEDDACVVISEDTKAEINEDAETLSKELLSF